MHKYRRGTFKSHSLIYIVQDITIKLQVKHLSSLRCRLIVTLVKVKVIRLAKISRTIFTANLVGIAPKVYVIVKQLFHD